MKRSSYGAFLAAILAAGVLVRAWTVIAIPTQPVSDFLGHFHVAENLAHEGRYEGISGVPDGKRSPAYPVLVSLPLRAVAPSQDLPTAKGVNLLLFALTGLFAASLSRSLWGDAAGLWSAAILAALPRSILMADLLAVENLIAPLLLLFLLIATRSWVGGFAAGSSVALGVVAALLCLTRAVMYLVPLVWLVGAIAARRRPRAIVGHLLLILAVQNAILLPWALRNERAFGRFTPFNMAGGIGLFIANNPAADGQWHPWENELEKRRPGVLARGLGAVDLAAREEALSWVRSNPGRACAFYLHRLEIILKDDAFAAEFTILAESISPPVPPAAVWPGAHALKTHGPGLHALLRFSGLLVGLAALGGFALLVISARRGSSVDRILAAGFLAAALYVPVVSAAMAVNGRYRWAAEDVALPLAGLFLATLGSRARFRSANGARDAAPQGP